MMEKQRVQAALRRESLGPLFEAAGHLRTCCETIRLLLDELGFVAVHLELLDAVLRAQHGNRWWVELSADIDSEGDR
jgi:hypothetical protein